ncbi:MAG: sigma-70 family RNA polymerase sigma factor [Acidimicrobiales bacterium]
MAEILRRHRDPVLAFAARLVGDHARAEEVAQDVFVRLWQRSERFDPTRGALRAFLLAMTHGRALDIVRSDSARFRREERHMARSTGAGEDPVAQVVARTVADAARNALAQLPEAERRAVELAYFGGHSYRTVASMLDEPEGTVKSRIRNGLARLRTALQAQDLQTG